MHIYRLNPDEFRRWRNRTTRETLKHEIHARRGDTQVRAPSGRILGTARSPERSGRIPIERTASRGAHHAVSPRECLCREWQKPAGKEHEHHPICMHKPHWEAQQARNPDALRERAISKAPQPSAPTPAARIDPPTPPAVPQAEAVSANAPRTPAPAPAPEPTPTPADCVCQGWSDAAAGNHHPLCQFREPWERAHGEVTPKLIELETGAVVRDASPEELAASKDKQSEDGVGAIELSDGKLYYVRAP